MDGDLEDDWSCSICFRLVLDPIVSACGHDFCRECLLRWAEQHAPSTSVACPLCRTAIASSYQDVTRLGVCVRLRQAVEALFPAQLKRRREQQQQQAKSETGLTEGGTAQRQAQALQHARRGRARYLRVRRTRPSGVGSPPPSEVLQALQQPHTQQQQQQQQQRTPAMGATAGSSSPVTPLSGPTLSASPSPLAPAQTAAAAAAGTALHALPSSPLAPHPIMQALPGAATLFQAGAQDSSSGSGSHVGTSGSWIGANLVPHFCIGWCEPLEHRRGRRPRRAKASRH